MSRGSAESAIRARLRTWLAVISLYLYSHRAGPLSLDRTRRASHAFCIPFTLAPLVLAPSCVFGTPWSNRTHVSRSEIPLAAIRIVLRAMMHEEGGMEAGWRWEEYVMLGRGQRASEDDAGSYSSLSFLFSPARARTSPTRRRHECAGRPPHGPP